MRFFAILSWGLFLIVRPALAQQIMARDWEWLVPAAPASSGFDPTWTWIDDRTLLLRLADLHDPLARADAHYFSTDRAKREAWETETRQFNDPYIWSIDFQRAQDQYDAGTATPAAADQYREAMLRESQRGPDTGGSQLAAIDLAGGLPPRRETAVNPEAWLSEQRHKGDLAAERAVCRLFLQPHILEGGYFQYCADLASHGGLMPPIGWAYSISAAPMIWRQVLVAFWPKANTPFPSPIWPWPSAISVRRRWRGRPAPKRGWPICWPSAWGSNGTRRKP